MTTTRLTKEVNVLSWDCGLSNIAYCLVEHVDDHEQEFKVRMWENFSLNELEVTEAIESLVRELEARPWVTHVDHVCIESQMYNNLTMKIISHSLQTYFVTKSKARVNTTPGAGATTYTSSGPRVHFIAPQNKFKVCSVPEPRGLVPGHNKNKAIAIAMARKMLKKQKDRTCLEYLDSHKKKDDLADSMLQGVYFLRELRKKRSMNRAIQGHLGRREIVIKETADPGSDKMSHVYRSENFSVPKFDVDGSSVSPKTTYSRFEVDTAAGASAAAGGDVS